MIGQHANNCVNQSGTRGTVFYEYSLSTKIHLLVFYPNSTDDSGQSLVVNTPEALLIQSVSRSHVHEDEYPPYSLIAPAPLPPPGIQSHKYEVTMTSGMPVGEADLLCKGSKQWPTCDCITCSDSCQNTLHINSGHVGGLCTTTPGTQPPTLPSGFFNGPREKRW